MVAVEDKEEEVVEAVAPQMAEGEEGDLQLGHRHMPPLLALVSPSSLVRAGRRTEQQFRRPR